MTTLKLKHSGGDWAAAHPGAKLGQRPGLMVIEVTDIPPGVPASQVAHLANQTMLSITLWGIHRVRYDQLGLGRNVLPADPRMPVPDLRA